MGRDIDILSSLVRGGLTLVRILLTTLNTILARKLELGEQSPKQWLKMIERLIIAVIPLHITASFIIPGLTDPETEGLPGFVKDARAKSAS